jgi:hypothetical protein
MTALLMGTSRGTGNFSRPGFRDLPVDVRRTIAGHVWPIAGQM